jgi:hypothetical protein
MNKTRFTLHLLATVVFTLTLTSLVQAQATRTWVSGVGDDANPCSRTAPCKTFAGAISKTFIGGEIDALDAGGFGTVTITKSITLDGGSGFASILASGVTGVNVNIAANVNDPERRVTLRRLSINGTGSSGAVGQRTGLKGINFIQGNAVYVENCYIQNFTQQGILMSVSGVSLLSVKDTNIQNCNVGIDVSTTNVNGAVLLADNLNVERMTGAGITMGANTFTTIRESSICFNGTDGLNTTAANTSGRLFVESSLVNHNPGVGIRAGAGTSATVISNTTVQSNGTAFATAGGLITSHGNNSVDGTIGVVPTIIGQQ